MLQLNTEEESEIAVALFQDSCPNEPSPILAEKGEVVGISTWDAGLYERVGIQTERWLLPPQSLYWI